MSRKILIVGSGLSGSSLSYFLRRSDALSVCIWEQSGTNGGRFNTFNDFNTSVDLGAQYITKKSNAHNDIYDELLSKNIIEPLRFRIDGSSLKENCVNYVGRSGMAAIVNYFNDGCAVRHNICVANVDFDGNSLIVTGKELIDSEVITRTEFFDDVIFATSTLSIQRITGNFLSHTHRFFSKLADVRYSKRFALALSFPTHSWRALENTEWGSKYVFECDVVRYISIENRKFANKEVKQDIIDENLVLLVHTSVGFGAEFASHTDTVIVATILEKLNVIIPGLGLPLNFLLHFWELSQVSKIIEWDETCALVEIPNQLQEKANTIGFIGDYFTESSFDGVLHSSVNMANLLLR